MYYAYSFVRVFCFENSRVVTDEFVNWGDFSFSLLVSLLSSSRLSCSLQKKSK